MSLVSVKEVHIIEGLKNIVSNTGFKGRWQILQQDPKVICDTAHNKEGLTYVMKQLLEEHFEALHIVLGVVNDKKLNDILSFFPKNAHYYFCKPNIPRGLNTKELEQKSKEFGLEGNAYKSVSEAYGKALAKNDLVRMRFSKNDLIKNNIFVGGSTFVVAEDSLNNFLFFFGRIKNRLENICTR